MLTYVQLHRPKTLAEAYDQLTKNRMSLLLGGGCWLRLSNWAWMSAIDLSGLDLKYIKEEESYFAIGAMSTQGDVERYPAFSTFANGVLVRSVQAILGAQFRNVATFGASVAARYGFSDIIPTLLALDAKVKMYKKGIIPLEEYLKISERDILLEVQIPKKENKIAVETHRKLQTDFPFLTGSMSFNEGGYHIYIGARPAPAVQAHRAGALLTEKGLEAIEEAIELVLEEVPFQTNSHASEEYRRALVPGMVRRMAKEIAAWK